MQTSVTTDDQFIATYDISVGKIKQIYPSVATYCQYVATYLIDEIYFAIDYSSVGFTLHIFSTVEKTAVVDIPRWEIQLKIIILLTKITYK